MNKLTVKLKQHTPLIHFQHDQEGATLRASEVKPKLDKFLIKYAFGNNFERCKTFLIGYSQKDESRIRTKFNEGKAGLNYKMRIWVDGNIEPLEYMAVSYVNNESKAILSRNGINVISNSPYFAQEDKTKAIVADPTRWDSIEKKGILYENVNLAISCISDSLMDEIEKNIQAFFLVNNFGTRQTKGFGGFEVIEGCLNGSKSLVLLENVDVLKSKFVFVYEKRLNSPSISQIFEQINDDYRLLKSGRRNPYAKSKIMLYGLTKRIRWEKRFLKRNIDDIYETQDNNEYENYYLEGRIDDKSISDHDDDRYRYLRAILGLAEQYEFLLKNPAVPKGKNKLIVKMKNETGVQRIKSPITFKVLGNCIYIVGDNIPQSILGKEFSVFVTIQGDDYWSNDELNERIQIPETFSLPDFMKYAMSNSNDNANLGYKAIKE